MILFLTYLLSVFSYLVPIFCFLPFKPKFSQKIGFFVIIFINILLIGYKLGNIGVILLLITTSIYIVTIHPLDRLLNICIFIATYLFCVLWDNIFSLIWNLLGFPISKLHENYLLFVLYVFVYIILLILICPLIVCAIHKLSHNVKPIISKEILRLIATNLFLCLFIFLFNIIIGDWIGYNTKIIAFNCILFGCYFIASTLLIINIIKSHIEKLNMEVKKDSYEKLQSYTSQIENMYKSLRSFKHDYFNIMLSISGYIDAGDINELKEFFYKEIIPINEKLSTNTNHLNHLMNIKIIELKSVISGKLIYASELGINVSIEICEEITQISMDTIDLSRVLGIFLDNAVEATLETRNPSIQFALIKEPTTLIFIVSNTFLDKHIPYANLKQPNISTKGPNRGIGLYNAHTIISRYSNVFLDTEITNDQFVQRLQISID